MNEFLEKDVNLQDRETASSPAPFDPELSQWKLLWILALAGLLMSMSFNIYISRQNNILQFQQDQQTMRLRQFQDQQKTFQSMAQEIAYFSIQHPEVRTILSKYGYNVNIIQPGDSPTSASPNVPKPPGQK